MYYGYIKIIFDTHYLYKMCNIQMYRTEYFFDKIFNFVYTCKRSMTSTFYNSSF